MIMTTHEYYINLFNVIGAILIIYKKWSYLVALCFAYNTEKEFSVYYWKVVLLSNLAHIIKVKNR